MLNKNTAATWDFTRYFFLSHFKKNFRPERQIVNVLCFQGGYIFPNPLTWLDRTVVDLGLALAEYASSEKAELQMDTTDEDFDSNSDEELHTLLSSKYELVPSSEEDIKNLKRSRTTRRLPRVSHPNPVLNDPISQNCLSKQLSVKE